MEKSGNPPPYIESAPPQAGFIPPPQQSPATTTTVTQVVVGATGQSFGPQQQAATCPHCKQQIVTRIETKASTKTHIIALVLCLVGAWCCCCIPYCVDSCQNRNHYCPHCSAYLGTFKN